MKLTRALFQSRHATVSVDELLKALQRASEEKVISLLLFTLAFVLRVLNLEELSTCLF